MVIPWARFAAAESFWAWSLGNSVKVGYWSGDRMSAADSSSAHPKKRVLKQRKNNAQIFLLKKVIKIVSVVPKKACIE